MGTGQFTTILVTLSVNRVCCYNTAIIIADVCETPVPK